MKIEISTEDNSLNNLLDKVNQLVDKIDPDDTHEIDCGFFIIETIGDLVHDAYDYFFGHHH